jgi:hypothetical protein
MARTAKRRAVVGVYNTREDAQKAVQELVAAGIPNNHIAVVMHHEHQKGVELSDMDAAKAAYVSGDSKARKGAVFGALAGGLGGGALALAAGLIPGVGPVLSAGLLGAMFFGVGAAVGATGGGIVGAMVGLDIPEAEAKFYESQLKAGKVLVGVHEPQRLDEARAILDRTGGIHAGSPGIESVMTGTAPVTQPAATAPAGPTATTAPPAAPVTGTPLNPPAPPV